MRFLILLLFIGCSTTPTKRIEESFVQPKMEFQNSKDNTIIMLDHKFFKIAYDTRTRLAKYVIYSLSAQQLRQRKAVRKNKFMPDQLLIQKGIPYVKPAEYARSGYDQGHLAPSADFAWNQEANDMTFVMSNMAPQKPTLNRDAWKRLEEQVRKWACGEGKVTVITGIASLNEKLHLKSGLRIPQTFYKIVIDETPPTKAMAFIYDQSDRGDLAAKRLVPLAKVEKYSGLPMNTYSRGPANIDEWKSEKCD